MDDKGSQNIEVRKVERFRSNSFTIFHDDEFCLEHPQMSQSFSTFYTSNLNDDDNYKNHQDGKDSSEIFAEEAEDRLCKLYNNEHHDINIKREEQTEHCNDVSDEYIYTHDYFYEEYYINSPQISRSFTTCYAPILSNNDSINHPNGKDSKGIFAEEIEARLCKLYNNNKNEHHGTNIRRDGQTNCRDDRYIYIHDYFYEEYYREEYYREESANEINRYHFTGDSFYRIPLEQK